MNRLFPVLVALGCALPGFAQRQASQLDASPALFSVMAAINAAGYDAGMDSPANSPVRKMVRDALASRKLESIEELRKFFAAHRKKDWTAELNQYISFALSIDGPPDFHFRVPVSELPPDAVPLQGFELILASFAKEANLADLWNKAQPAYEQAIDAYHGPVSRALLEANGYLRNPTSGYLGRRFQIYIDLLGEPNQIQSRSYKDDYFVVVMPSEDLRTADIRHAYLHYLLDPLALKYSEQLNKRKSMMDYAQPAPALEEAYKDDYILFATECFIKAVESRLALPSRRQVMAGEALKQGFVMTPAFADGLAAFEKQPAAMRLYFPDLVASIDIRKEGKRLENVQFDAAPTVRTVKSAPHPKEPQVTGAEKMLADAQALSAKRSSPPEDVEKARKLFLESLQKTTNSTLHARAYYGLARIAALQQHPDLAEKLFQKTLELTPDPETKSWSYVYLGRLAEAANQREDAEKNYRAALAVAGAPASATSAAENGLQKYLNQK